MTAARYRSVNIRSGRRSTNVITQTVGRCVVRDDRPCQRYARRADADAAARTFGRRARRLIGSALIYAGVAGSGSVEAECAVIDIQRRGIIRDRTAVCEAARAVLTAVQTAVGLSAVAAVAAECRVIRKGRGIHRHRSALREDRSAASGSSITGRVTAEARRAERMSAVAAVRRCEIECRISDSHIRETVKRAPRSVTAGICAVAARARIAAGRVAVRKRRVGDRDRPAAEPRTTALRKPAKAAVSLAVLILIAAVAAGRVAILELRFADVQRAARKVDRAARRIRSRAVIKVSTVSSARVVAGEFAIGNVDHRVRRHARNPAASRIERGVIVDNMVAFA